MHTSTSRGRILVGLIVLSLAAGVAVVGGVAAQETTNNTSTANTTNTTGANASLSPDPSAANASANHTLSVTVPESVAGNLTGMSINYTEANASTETTLKSNLLSVEGSNGSVPVGADDEGNITIEGAPEFREVTITADMNESLQPAAGERLNLTYPVKNPQEAGNYSVPVVLNPEGNESVNYSANLSITESNDTGGSSANASVSADPDTANASANHTAAITIPESVAGNLTGVSINYTEANASTETTLKSNLLSVEGSNGSVPVGADDEGNITIEGAPEFREVTITADLNESLQPAAGDELSLTYPVKNPQEAGNYSVPIVLNPEGNESVNYSATLSITENETSAAGENGTTTGMATTAASNGSDNTTSEATTEMMTTEAATTEMATTEEATTEEAETTEEASGGETTTSSGNGPGFTAIAALVGVLAAALLATRRD